MPRRSSMPFSISASFFSSRMPALSSNLPRWMPFNWRRTNPPTLAPSASPSRGLSARRVTPRPSISGWNLRLSFFLPNRKLVVSLANRAMPNFSICTLALADLRSSASLVNRARSSSALRGPTVARFGSLIGSVLRDSRSFITFFRLPPSSGFRLVASGPRYCTAESMPRATMPPAGANLRNPLANKDAAPGVAALKPSAIALPTSGATSISMFAAAMAAS